MSAIPPLPLDVRQEVGDEFGFEVINLHLRRWGALRLNNFRLLEIGSKTAAITARETKLIVKRMHTFPSTPGFSQTQFCQQTTLRKASVTPPQSGSGCRVLNVSQ
jgi:hypothetical protein